MKLALGTAQFGLAYGISNTEGKTPPDEVREILALARDRGIEILDSAALYGESEAVLGAVGASEQGFKIITKTIRIGNDRIEASDVAAWRNGLYQSIERLRAEAVEGVLAHHADDLMAAGGDRLYAEMQAFRGAGKVRKIGVSVYEPGQLESFLHRYPEIQIVQLPLNVLDQRMWQSGLLDELQRRGVEVHTRSVFLQGLLLMPPDSLPAKLAAAAPLLRRIRETSHELGISVQAFLFAFLARLAPVTNIIVGVNNRRQLLDNIEAYEGAANIDFDYSSFACDNPTLIDPRKW